MRQLLMALVLMLVVIPPATAYLDPEESANPLIRHGLLSPENKKLSIPDEIDVSEREIARFAVAVVDIAVLRNRISARMALGEENDKDLIHEWTNGLTEILLRAELTIERYLILDTVAETVPLIGDDLKRHALLQRYEQIPLMEPVSSFRDFQRLLEGHVNYTVDRKLYNQAAKRLKQSLPANNDRLPSLPGIAN